MTITLKKSVSGSIRRKIERNFDEAESGQRIRLDVVFNQKAAEPSKELRGMPVEGIIFQDELEPQADVLQFTRCESRESARNAVL